MKKTKKKLRKYVVLLSNHVNRDDDDSIELMAYSIVDATEKAKEKCDFRRYSLNGVYLKKDLR